MLRGLRPGHQTKVEGKGGTQNMAIMIRCTGSNMIFLAPFYMHVFGIMLTMSNIWLHL